MIYQASLDEEAILLDDSQIQEAEKAEDAAAQEVIGTQTDETALPQRQRRSRDAASSSHDAWAPNAEEGEEEDAATEEWWPKRARRRMRCPASLEATSTGAGCKAKTEERPAEHAVAPNSGVLPVSAGEGHGEESGAAVLGVNEGHGGSVEDAECCMVGCTDVGGQGHLPGHEGSYYFSEGVAGLSEHMTSHTQIDPVESERVVASECEQEISTGELVVGEVSDVAVVVEPAENVMPSQSDQVAAVTSTVREAQAEEVLSGEGSE